MCSALAQAPRRKELRYPELVGQAGRAKLVVLVKSVGGWSEGVPPVLVSVGLS